MGVWLSLSLLVVGSVGSGEVSSASFSTLASFCRELPVVGVNGIMAFVLGVGVSTRD